MKVRFLFLYRDETWQKCSPRYPLLKSGTVNLSMWNKLVKSKMASKMAAKYILAINSATTNDRKVIFVSILWFLGSRISDNTFAILPGQYVTLWVEVT